MDFVGPSPLPKLLRSGQLAPAPHAFSTRVGGVSTGVFSSLNLGNPMELAGEQRDPPAHMAENFRRILAAIGCDGRRLVQVHQKHGAAVHTARTTDPIGPLDPRADAIITDDPALVLCIRVADCCPVLLASLDGRVVGAVHAGWRGVIAGILPNAIAAMRTLGTSEISAAIGPCISAAHFEVGPEVVAQFRHAFGAAAPIERETPDGKAFVDLKESLRLQLRAAGIERIEVLPHCTFADPALFYSHRRERGLTGRMGAFISPK